MAKETPVGVAQKKVLDALNLHAETWNEANAIFSKLGIVVGAKRVGRTSEPVVSYSANAYGGGFNQYGEGESWNNIGDVDLAPIKKWMA